MKRAASAWSGERLGHRVSEIPCEGTTRGRRGSGGAKIRPSRNRWGGIADSEEMIGGRRRRGNRATDLAEVDCWTVTSYVLLMAIVFRCDLDVLSAARSFFSSMSIAAWSVGPPALGRISIRERNGKHTRHYGGARARHGLRRRTSAANAIARIDKARADSAQSRRWEGSKMSPGKIRTKSIRLRWETILGECVDARRSRTVSGGGQNRGSGQGLWEKFLMLPGKSTPHRERKGQHPCLQGWFYLGGRGFAWRP